MWKGWEVCAFALSCTVAQTAVKKIRTPRITISRDLLRFQKELQEIAPGTLILPVALRAWQDFDVKKSPYFPLPSPHRRVTQRRDPRGTA